MVSCTNTSLNLNVYKNLEEQFIYGLKGIIRLPLGMEIIYHIARSSIETYSKIPPISKMECIFAVTDKRIILIPINDNYSPISFKYGDINISYYDQLFDKIFLLDVQDKKLFDFNCNKLVFRIYSKQNAELNKVNCVLQEHDCA